MLGVLAQTTLDSNGTEGLQALFSGAFLFVWLVVVAVLVVSLWKIFEKAGRPGWAALIPVYNVWVMAEVAGKPGWWALLFLLSWIPVIGFIIALVVSIVLSMELAKSFGKEPVFALLLILLPVIGYPLLAFGDSAYVGAGGEPGEAPTETPVDA